MRERALTFFLAFTADRFASASTGWACSIDKGAPPLPAPAPPSLEHELTHLVLRARSRHQHRHPERDAPLPSRRGRRLVHQLDPPPRLLHLARPRRRPAAAHAQGDRPPRRGRAVPATCASRRQGACGLQPSRPAQGSALEVRALLSFFPSTRRRCRPDARSPPHSASFAKLDTTIHGFLSAIPREYQFRHRPFGSGLGDVLSETRLHLVHGIAHASSILLHEPYVSTLDEDEPSLVRCVESANEILQAVFLIVGASPSLSSFLFSAFLSLTLARSLYRYLVRRRPPLAVLHLHRRLRGSHLRPPDRDQARQGRAVRHR